MNTGLFGFKSDRLIKKQSVEIVNNVGLETYTIPSADYLALSGTINLPSSGEWLLVGIVLINASSSGILEINSTGVLFATSGIPLEVSFSKKITGGNFTYTRNSDTSIIEFYAIKLSGGNQ